LKRNGGFVPGSSRETNCGFIDSILSKITLPGAIFLAAVAILPLCGESGHHTEFCSILRRYFAFDFGRSGIGYTPANRKLFADEHYEGMMKSGRVKGRSQFAAA